MKKAIFLVIGILIISGFAAGGITNTVNVETKVDYYSVDDLSARQVLAAMNPELAGKLPLDLYTKEVTSGRDYPIGEIIWQYYITGGYDNSIKAILPIEDINSDGIGEVIVCSEDYYVRCFDGSAIGTGVILWAHEIYSGALWCQNMLTITEDVDGDGYDDVVVGTDGGDRSIHTLSGQDGNEIWDYDTHEYGGGGWVYQVDCSYDYNGDGVIDVLATTGGLPDGPRRVYCLDGEDGTKIWDCPLGSPRGPGFSVIGIEDFTGDGQPDVLAGASNSYETVGYAYGINGATGIITWTFTVPGSSVWALEQIDDITSDGIKDVIIGDFSGNIYGLDATDGGQEYSNSIAPAIITRFEKLNDVNGDGHPDIVPAHSTSHVTQVIDGQTGGIIWSHAVADQPWNVARIADISGDGIDDVLVGTLFQNNYCYFLNGVDGSELFSTAYPEAVDAIGAVSDSVNDGSMEMVAGGRNGKVTCLSGGLDSGTNDPPTIPAIDGPTSGAVDVSYEFTIVSTEPDGDDVYYYIDWDDGNVEDWIGPYASGVVVTVSHSWSSEDTYSILAKAKDTYGAESDWSDPFIITIVESDPPGAPVITGTVNGAAGTSYDYDFTAIDPDGDDVQYYIDWGDGETEWTSFAASNTPVTASHTWIEQDTYVITAKAKDEYGLEGPEATMSVSMPRNRAINTPFLHFLQNHLVLFQLFQRLFNL